MLDGSYQSVICFFFAYLNFRPATFVTESGQDIGDSRRIGVYAGIPAVIAANTYILMNTYRWDWLIVLLVSISILLVFFWTGVYSAFTASQEFYHAAPEVFAQATFWATMFLSVVACLLPRFAAKTIQKIYYPRDIDVIREQVRQGKFDYLDQEEGKPFDSDSKGSSAGSSHLASPRKHFHQTSLDEDQRPIYASSVAATTITTARVAHSQHSSDGTDYTRNHTSDYETPVTAYDMEHPNYDPTSAYATPFEFPQSQSRTSYDMSRTSMDRPRISIDRPRPSFDRLRSSMDRIRPSFEKASLSTNDFTSAALLTRVESSNSGAMRREQNNTESSGRSFPLVKY